MTNPTIETRCADGAACIEVLARLDAAHVAKYVDGDDAQADQLFTGARRWADAHLHGSPDEPPPAMPPATAPPGARHAQ